MAGRAASEKNPRKNIGCIAVLVALTAVIAGAVAVGVVFMKEKAETVFVPASPSTLQSASWADEPVGALSQSVQYVSHIVGGTEGKKGEFENVYHYAYSKAFWDDSWFDADGRAYNHQLATAVMTLNAAVNAETQHYSTDAKSNDCARIALEGFGFTNVDTSSFEGASKLKDEVKLFLAKDMDKTAWTFARKTIGSGEDSFTLIYVGIRGTYATEWVSDVTLTYPEWEGATKDHVGYRLAALELEEGLAKYIREQNIDTKDLKILVSGHSRGGSVANLVAHDILKDVDTDGQIVSPERLFAYTFATSATTRNKYAASEQFRSIHNIVNPTDIVPMMPLSKWGFTCYGTTHRLPGMQDPNFDALYSAMQANRALMTGYESKKPYYQGEVNPAEMVIEEVGKEVPDLTSFKRRQAIVDLVKVLAPVDVYRIAVSHFPDTYIAWMQVTTKYNLH